MSAAPGRAERVLGDLDGDGAREETEAALDCGGVVPGHTVAERDATELRGGDAAASAALQDAAPQE